MKVLIGTPAYDFKLHANYVESLLTTIGLCGSIGIQVDHLFLCGDALIQRARNDIFKTAYEGDFDYLFFIDADIFWKPEDFIKLVMSGKDIIAASYRKKSDLPVFTVKIKEETDGDIISVAGAGTGFMCISKNAIKKIYENSIEYAEQDRKNRMVFNIGIINGQFYGEDILFCQNWTDMGGEVFVDTNITIGHIGEKQYIGNLSEHLKNLKVRTEETGK